MSVQSKATVLFLALGLVPRPAPAQTNIKKFADEVRPILLPDEEKQWKTLKDNRDKEEFAKIFWARRDPDLEAPGNEYRTAFEAARTDANQRFQGAGRPGADTDCGRVFILLGAPDEVMAGTEPGGRKLESAKLAREAQTWTYRDRPGMKFKDGKVQIAFDESCMLPQGARFGEQLNAVAASKIVNPNLDYKKTADGHVVKLEEQLPKPTPIMALLKQPRQDFAAEVEQSVVMRSADGATYVAGLVRVDPSLLSADGPAATAVVGVQAVADGKTAASTEREMKVDLVPGAKAAVYSWGLALRPGDYELRVGVLDPKTGKGSATVQKVSAPDFGAEQFSMSPLVLLEDIEQGPAGPQHPLSAFQFGDMRMKPRFGNVYAPADAVTLIAFVYSAQMPPAADAATPAKPSLTATFTVLKEGQAVAKADPQNYDSLPAVLSVGPVPLAKYGPGKFKAQVVVRDNVAAKDYTREVSFEVR